MVPSSGEEKDWVEVIFYIHPIAQDALSAFLFDMGCTGVVSEERPTPSLKAYFRSPLELEAFNARLHDYLQDLRDIFPEAASVQYDITPLKDQDWSLGWRRFFGPDRVSPRLLILPAWEPVPEHVPDHVIRIDPGPAFGTGGHPTTRMCLEAMERCSLEPPWTMLDVGTGSGILAIYGALLDAKKVLAVDIDPEALRWADRNISLNGLTGSIELSHQPAEGLRGPFSLLTANLFLREILRLLHHFFRLIRPGGRLILSGILKEQVKELREALTQYSCEEPEIFHQEEWACVVAEKRAEERS